APPARPRPIAAGCGAGRRVALPGSRSGSRGIRRGSRVVRSCRCCRSWKGRRRPERGPSAHPRAERDGRVRISLWISGGQSAEPLVPRCCRRICDAPRRPKNEGRLSAPPGWIRLRWRSGHFALDHHLDGGFDVGVQVDHDVVLAGAADGALTHDHFGLLDRVAGLGQRLGDVAGRDRTVELAFRGGIRTDRHRHVGELGLAGLGVVVHGLGLGFVLGAARLELGQVGLGRRRGLALRDQEVAAVTRLDVDLVAELAEVLHVLQEDQLHGGAPYSLAGRVAPQQCCPNDREVDQALWLSVYGISARKRARLTAVASWRWYFDLVPVTRDGTILPVSVRYWRRVLRSL